MLTGFLMINNKWCNTKQTSLLIIKPNSLMFSVLFWQNNFYCGGEPKWLTRGHHATFHAQNSNGLKCNCEYLGPYRQINF